VEEAFSEITSTYDFLPSKITYSQKLLGNKKKPFPLNLISLISYSKENK
jgi:hypothetical protein